MRADAHEQVRSVQARATPEVEQARARQVEATRCAGHHDVGRRQVEVQDTGRVRVGETREHARRHDQRVSGGQWTGPRDEVGERDPVHELQDDPRQPVLAGSGVEHMHHVRVIQPRGDPCLGQQVCDHTWP